MVTFYRGLACKPITFEKSNRKLSVMTQETERIGRDHGEGRHATKLYRTLK